MNSFEKFLESRGFHADACRSTVDPDFYALAETLHAALMRIGDQGFKGETYRPALLPTAHAKGLHARMTIS